MSGQAYIWWGEVTGSNRNGPAVVSITSPLVSHNDLFFILGVCFVHALALLDMLKLWSLALFPEIVAENTHFRA